MVLYLAVMSIVAVIYVHCAAGWFKFVLPGGGGDPPGTSRLVPGGAGDPPGTSRLLPGGSGDPPGTAILITGGSPPRSEPPLLWCEGKCCVGDRHDRRAELQK